MKPASYQPEMFWNFPVFKVTKTDDGNRLVEGYATTDEPDSSGEVVTGELVKGARDKYMQRGNVREMHQLSAAGKVVSDRFDEEEGGPFKWWIQAKVVDAGAIKKIDEGVYTGFSVGIDRVKRDPMNRKKMIGGDIVEISLVDRPHNEACNLTACRAAGAQVFKIMGVPDTGKTTKSSTQKTGEVKTKMVGKAQVIKAMYHVQGMAEILQRLDQLAKDFTLEQIQEQDTSELATQLQAQLKDIRQDLGEVLIGMTTMEVGELLQDVGRDPGDTDQAVKVSKNPMEGDTEMTPQELKEVVGQVIQAVMPEVIKASKKDPVVTGELIDEVKKAHKMFCDAVEKGDVEEVKKAHKLYAAALKAAGLGEEPVTEEKQKVEEAKKVAGMEAQIAALETLVNKIAGTPQTPKSNAGTEVPETAVDGLVITKPETVTKIKELLAGGFGNLDENLTPRERKVEEDKREKSFVKLTAAIYGGQTTSPEVIKIARQEFLN